MEGDHSLDENGLSLQVRKQSILAQLLSTSTLLEPTEGNHVIREVRGIDGNTSGLNLGSDT